MSLIEKVELVVIVKLALEFEKFALLSKASVALNKISAELLWGSGSSFSGLWEL